MVSGRISAEPLYLLPSSDRYELFAATFCGGGVQMEVAPLGDPHETTRDRGAVDAVDEAADEESPVQDRDALLQAAVSRAVQVFHALHAREPDASVVAELQPYVQGAATGRRIPLCVF
jgi:hypothetical protein